MKLRYAIIAACLLPLSEIMMSHLMLKSLAARQNESLSWTQCRPASCCDYDGFLAPLPVDSINSLFLF